MLFFDLKCFEGCFMKTNYQKFKKYNLLNIINLLLLFTIIVNIGFMIWQNKDKYINFDYQKRYINLETIYKNSQYVNKNAKDWIPDEIVNSYAGGAYIKGINPILIAPDTPPLGRYLIGASSFLFNNENIIILFCGLLILTFMYLLGVQVLDNKTLSLLAVLLISLEPIFKNQFVYVPLLDIIQLSFLLPSFYFFNKGLRKEGKIQLFLFFLASVFLGFFISTKFFITGITIIFSWYIVLLLNKLKKGLINLTFVLPIAFLILLLSYIRVFSFGYDLKKFLGIQKWVFLYHKSQLILPFSVWPLILFNRWYVWYGDKPIISDFQWRISWPIIFIFSLITIILVLLKKIPRKIEMETLGIWVILYVLFFSFGQITSRYLVIYIPILYIISLYGIKSLYKMIYGK